MHFWMCFHCFCLPPNPVTSSFTTAHALKIISFYITCWQPEHGPEPRASSARLPATCSVISAQQDSTICLFILTFFFPMSLCIGALPPPKKTSTLCVALLRMWIFYLPIRPQCWFSQFNQHWRKTIGTKRFTKTILYDWDIDCLGTSINFWTTSPSSPTPFLPSRILSNLIEKCFAL